MMVARLRIALLYALVLVLSPQLPGDDYGYSMENGLALVTTVKGEVTLGSGDATAHGAQLHAVEALTGKQIRTGAEAHVFFSLSNGSGLGVDENSQLKIKSYRQVPFSKGKESHEYEPTFSELILQLYAGSVSFSAELSPLSQYVIELPHGRISSSEATGRLVYDEQGATITLARGLLRYSHPDGEDQIINAPAHVQIVNRSDQAGRIIELAPASQRTAWLIEATTRAAERAIYRISSDQASIPRPILVAKPEDLLKPMPRPYSYTK